MSASLYRCFQCYNYGCLAAILIHGLYAILFLLLGFEFLALYSLFSIGVFIFSIYLNFHGRMKTSLLLVFLEILVHVSVFVMLLGWDSGFHHYILILVMVAFFAPWKGYRAKAFMTLFCYIVYIMLAYYASYHSPIEKVSDTVLNSLNWANITGVFLVVAILSHHFNHAATTAEELFEKEHQRSEELLHNILPVSIAERLKDKPETIADSFKETTTLFADIVGFTQLSTKVSPKELVQLLNQLFTEFDMLSEKYQLEKIKTIGDAYMIASGLPEYRKDHAEVMAQMALDMIKVTKEVNAQIKRETDLNTEIDIRIGINSGAVVAGVIGKKKFAYDLWGDSVNTAARMESHGVSGKIHVTQETYELLKEKYSFIKRRAIEIKGKGLTETYFLSAQKIL